MKPRQTTVRLPEDLAEEAEAIARVNGTSINAVIVDALTNEINRVRNDKEFNRRVKAIVKRDGELLKRLVK